LVDRLVSVDDEADSPFVSWREQDMPKKDDAYTTESEVTLLADDELDAVAGGKTEGGKPAPGKLNFEHYFDKSGP
jgi:hypothetical protein